MFDGLSYYFAGEQIADFQLVSLLGLHELTECWYAIRGIPGEAVAVKFLRRENPRIPQFLVIAEFLRCQRSNFLIHVLEYGKTVQGLPYAVLEYIPGGSLRNLLDRIKVLPVPQAVFLMRGMLNALTVLHSRGFVHRDIKPENIWIDAKGGFRLGDLGLVKLPGIKEERGNIFGTAAYIAPEQADDSTRVDARSDLYSLAAILYEALTGTRLRPKGNFLETMRYARLESYDKDYSELYRVVPKKFAQLLLAMLSFDPEQRPVDAPRCLAMLDAIVLPCAEKFDKSCVHPSVAKEK